MAEKKKPMPSYLGSGMAAGAGKLFSGRAAQIEAAVSGATTKKKKAKKK